jgi:hypothetical protein
MGTSFTSCLPVSSFHASGIAYVLPRWLKMEVYMVMLSMCLFCALMEQLEQIRGRLDELNVVSVVFCEVGPQYWQIRGDALERIQHAQFNERQSYIPPYGLTCAAFVRACDHIYLSC